MSGDGWAGYEMKKVHTAGREWGMKIGGVISFAIGIVVFWLASSRYGYEDAHSVRRTSNVIFIVCVGVCSLIGAFSGAFIWCHFRQSPGEARPIAV